MDISIRSIQEHELSGLLNLYKHLNRTDDPLPDESTLQQICEVKNVRIKFIDYHLSNDYSISNLIFCRLYVTIKVIF